MNDPPLKYGDSLSNTVLRTPIYINYINSVFNNYGDSLNCLDLILLFASLNDELEQFNFVIIVEMSVIYDRIIYNHYNDII